MGLLRRGLIGNARAKRTVIDELQCDSNTIVARHCQSTLIPASSLLGPEAAAGVGLGPHREDWAHGCRVCVGATCGSAGGAVLPPNTRLGVEASRACRDRSRARPGGPRVRSRETLRSSRGCCACACAGLRDSRASVRHCRGSGSPRSPDRKRRAAHAGSASRASEDSQSVVSRDSRCRQASSRREQRAECERERGLRSPTAADWAATTATRRERD